MGSPKETEPVLYTRGKTLLYIRDKTHATPNLFTSRLKAAVDAV